MGLFDNLKTIIKFSPDKPITASSPAFPKKILIVDDDDSLRNFYVTYLAQQGYITLQAINGQEGVKILQIEKPALLILDLNMPVMDGKTMLREIRKSQDFKKMPVIILTNEGSIENIEETQLYNNANVFLVKCNTTPQMLFEEVKKLIY